MTTHELARLLLECADVTVFVDQYIGCDTVLMPVTGLNPVDEGLELVCSFN